MTALRGPGERDRLTPGEMARLFAVRPDPYLDGPAPIEPGWEIAPARSVDVEGWGLDLTD